MSRVLPMANSYARVRDFISRLVHLRRELDIVSLARTVKIQEPIIPIGGVCILRMATSARRFRDDRNMRDRFKPPSSPIF